jgi:hypothetical protein
VSLVAITLTPLSSPDMVGRSAFLPIGHDQTLQARSDIGPVVSTTSGDHLDDSRTAVFPPCPADHD